MTIDEILEHVVKTKGSAFFYTPSIYKNSKSFFFERPEKFITSRSQRSLLPAIERFDTLIQKNNLGYCLLNYEAGYCFEEKLEKILSENNEPLFRGFIFSKNNVKEISSVKINFSNCFNNYKISNFRICTSRKTYIDNVKKIKKYIAEGDTYQVNYTVTGKFKFSGSLAEFFKSLIFNQSAKYSAFINLGNSVVISASPELFFQQTGLTISVRPMKGTISRDININADIAKIHELLNSEKEQAENIMIVDLLRNDLGKISKYGSVKVKELFRIEKYESLYQMVSTIEAQLNSETRLSQIIKNLFPCGSVTGAPKIRTMEIIREMEKRNRGIYTGTIGIARKDECVFNVAIRTIVIDKNGSGRIGIGSGIVWDSDAEKEYSEVLLKSKFLIESQKEFYLFETMKFENGRIKDFEKHCDRLEKSAEYFLFSFDKKKFLKETQRQIDAIKSSSPKRVKIILDKRGNLEFVIKECIPVTGKTNVIISKKRVSSKNVYQYFKTSNRKLYDEEYAKYSNKGFFDVLFFNEKGELAEGAITNIFIRKGNDWLTPPINAGILPGIERSNFLERNPQIKEQIIRLEDLYEADEIVLTNSLRGKIVIDNLCFNEKSFRKVS